MQITIFGTLSSVDPLIARALAGTGRKLTGRCNRQSQIAGPALDACIRDLLKSKIGPAALIMAMAALDEQQPLTTLEELRLWREATTIFMLAGHGGCGPHGLALAAWNRGFEASAWISMEGALFKDTVRSEDKKRVLELVHEGFLHDIGKTGIQLHHDPLTLEAMEEALHEGRIPVILISTWQLYRSRVPHWVTVCAIDDQFVYLHDPEIDTELGETVADKQYLPVDRRVFSQISRYGRNQPLQAAIIVGPKRPA